MLVGLSKSKYEHLRNGLILVENILSDFPEMPFRQFKTELEESQARLDAIFKEYEILLAKLNYYSRYYNQLALDVKVGVLASTLKTLKSNLPVESLAYERLKDSIRLIKST